MSWHHRYGRSATTADTRRYLIQKMNNPTCASCQASGYSHHRHYEIIDPDLLRLTFS